MIRANLDKIKILDTFYAAEAAVLEAGYEWEIEWQKERKFENFDEQDLLREAAWVILNSGFRESIIRKKFNYISLCFCDWESAAEISKNKELCVSTALKAFGNKRKIGAIGRIAEIVHELGFQSFKSKVLFHPIQQLQKLPFIGPVTSYHLAKNLGLDVAKNDRHLANYAKYCGYNDAHKLCEFLSKTTGNPRSVVDIILWRAAALGKPLIA